MTTPPVRPGTILIAIPTFRRPKMLREALASVDRIEIPNGVKVSVIVIDNDREQSARSVCQEFARTSLRVDCVVEPTRGLTAVRNRALALARERRVEALAFLDDDEVADRDWLAALWRTLQETGADLIGGPVAACPPREPITLWQHFVLRSVAAGLRARFVWRRWRMRLGAPATIVTNNWMARMPFVERHALRFDARFSSSGGEDTDFYRQVVAAGGRTAWSSEARVSETVPAARLRFGYIFRRRFDSGVTRTGDVAARLGVFAASCRFVPGACLMFVAGSVLVVLSPLTAWLTLPMALAQFGRGTGYFAGLLGARSEHYRTTTGY